MKVFKTNIAIPIGFKVSSGHAGIRKIKKDIAMIYSENPATCSAVFSQNFPNGAPIKISLENYKKSDTISAIIVNSGNANVYTGLQGEQDAKEMTKKLSSLLKIDEKQVMVASTGVTGLFLPMDKIIIGIETIASILSSSEDDVRGFAEAIGTTDTNIKVVSVEVEINGIPVKILGIAKGSGMVSPRMATTLTFLMTDADISKEILDKSFKSAINKSLNRISIDGETSPNDMAVILANGLAKNKKITTEDENYKIFSEAIKFVTLELAKKIVEDGEGITKILQIQVSGAKTEDDADKLFRGIANSTLVKTAFFGENANWGRIVAAMGATGVKFNYDKTTITISGSSKEVMVCENGMPQKFDELKTKEIFQEKNLFIDIKLQDGDASIVGWSCDLSYDYVKINSSYRDGKTNMEKYIEKASILTQALPYITKFNNMSMVIKYGGSALIDDEIKKVTIADISLLNMLNMKPIVVHGGGPFINEELIKSKIQPEFKNGVRVTDAETMKIVEKVLSGEVNKSLVSDFQRCAVNAVGISGKDSSLFEVKKDKNDIGFVGEIVKVNSSLVNLLIENNYIPVISPVSTDDEMNSYNVNADYAAVELAMAMKVSKLIFLTDVNGILYDPDDPESLISSTNPRELLSLIEQGVIKGGMIPKVKSCIRAIENGVGSVQIINAKIKHALLLEIFTNDGIGTIIKGE
ncbi:MAG: bifunctional glutamate N-acetyltransferase/amino-acid acetyltransferase ArgJ [Rickettsiales bacterium]|jgi:glutamate N-acetyltransferase/amino-acid N-acetyltransferase|nr:bifunctional glutamate N-acetyltransferase/amino-acid acetyltransferase ArgJ [Rickettsiales bacterium]